MFPTFSGSSRRPRQVNLSGHAQNPFAANAWGSASASQQAVANAQQERLQRQQDREKLNASKRIQRIWRGHRIRKELADSRRSSWDKIEAEGRYSDANILSEQLRLLSLFYSPLKQQDLGRLVQLAQKISNIGCADFLTLQNIQNKLPKLSNVVLEALQDSLPGCPISLLELLVGIVQQQPDTFSGLSRQYFTYLSTLLSTRQPGELGRGSIITALRIPLSPSQSSTNSYIDLRNAYAAFALHFLTIPSLSDLLGPMRDIAAQVDISLLSAALVQEFSSTTVQVEPENQLWLLANFICLHRFQKHSSREPDFLRALSLQLSSCSAEIVGRIDSGEAPALNEDDLDKVAVAPLPPFVKGELLSLVNKSSITGLLEKFNVDYAKASPAGEEDASLLASYALTLLRIFPRRSDEIRMWLYRGSISSNHGSQLPALKFFWHAARKTSIFTQIRADSKTALTLLRAQTLAQTPTRSLSSTDIVKDREWRTILLFLELYTFVLRITDDEEFLSAGNLSLRQDNWPTSRTKESALAMDDVKLLTLFLKNLAFTTYFNAGELTEANNSAIVGGLGSYFGTTSTKRFRSPELEKTAESMEKRPFAGIASMTFDYVRTITTGVMRMLYERDSRRRFLPKDHWLMTSRFDMEGFIPAVVMEEEKRHEVSADEEEDSAELDEIDEFSHERSGLIGMGRPRRAQQIEAMRKTQQQAARKKVLASVAPRLEVLQHMPFVIPFDTRVQIFRQFVLLDQTRRRDGNVDPDIWRLAVLENAQHGPRRRAGHEVLGRHHAKIRRDQIFEDAYEQFYELGEGLKEPIQITFVDQFDTVEAGIDGGGVTKEFLTSVTKEAFNSESASSLFITNDQNLLYPNPVALDAARHFLKEAGIQETEFEWKNSIREVLKHYEFLGRVVGKCLYEGILIDINFAGFFLLKWAASGLAGDSSYRANINDLRDLDESLYQGLLQVKNYPGNVEDLSLDFTITDTVAIPDSPTVAITRELAPNGAEIAVTNENKPLYIYNVARHRLQIQPYQQTQAFLKGLGDIIKPSWLSMFNQSELQTLIGGDSSEIDVEDLRQNTLYGGVYQIGDDGEEHDTVKLFWKVLKELDDEERRKVLKYVTSTPRAPLLGFSQLNPRFSIRDAGSDEERLPSTSTCVNLLKLPRYTTKRTLKEKLLYAVNSGAGFDLS